MLQMHAYFWPVVLAVQVAIQIRLEIHYNSLVFSYLKEGGSMDKGLSAQI